MDTGPTFARLATPIGPEETAGELGERLARMGADAVREWLPRYVAGGVTLEPQDHAQATMAPVLDKTHGRIDWAKSARRVHDHVRGMSPWPGAYTTARGKTVKVHATRVVEGARAAATAGTVILADKSRVLVACGEGTTLELASVQPEGKRAMKGSEWAMGRGVAEGDLLGSG
jgi:methionyl-tRNA formyltransferase